MTIRNTALSVLFCLASAPAFAGGTVVAQVNDASPSIAQITLFDTGELTVIPRDKMRPASLTVTPANVDNVLSLATVLARETIVTDHRAAVCLIEVAGGNRTLSVGEYDTVSSRFVGSDAHTVLSSQGCWNLTYTHPQDAYAVTDADQLETMLVTLGNQALGYN